MLQEFFINDIEEITELNDDIYGIMNKRIAYCKCNNSTDLPYGPPDICYIVKESQSKGFLSFNSKKHSKIGSYHYVYGLDTSNLAYISAYISKYIQKVNTKEYKITQSIFCIFDYFLEKDLRILLKFPGGIRKVFYIDDQQAIEANPEELKTVYLSSIIRALSVEKININSIYLDEINNIDSFNYIKDAIRILIKENSEFKYPNFKVKISVLLDYFIKYLINTRRFNFTIIYFNECNII